MTDRETPPLRGPYPTKTWKIDNLLFNIAYADKKGNLKAGKRGSDWGRRICNWTKSFGHGKINQTQHRKASNATHPDRHGSGGRRCPRDSPRTSLTRITDSSNHNRLWKRPGQTGDREPVKNSGGARFGGISSDC